MAISLWSRLHGHALCVHKPCIYGLIPHMQSLSSAIYMHMHPSAASCSTTTNTCSNRSCSGSEDAQASQLSSDILRVDLAAKLTM
jgi:hypothetical protein